MFMHYGRSSQLLSTRLKPNIHEICVIDGGSI
jgi:hypothetical protein